ncbi:MAG: hypothetical protein ACJ768_19850 [Gaiellaceae bacterium]
MAALLALLACVPSANAASFFGSGATWNTPLPLKPKLDSTSSRIVSSLSLWMKTKALEGEYPGIATDRYSTPVYTADASTARQPVVIDPGTPAQGDLIQAIDAVGGVPFPANAKPAAGTDGHITVYDPGADALYELWRASSPSMNATNCVTPLPWGVPCHRDGQWHAEWGGMMDHVSSSPGFFSVDSWPGLTGTEGYDWGATATSLPLLAGLITFGDLSSGTIDHALAGSFVGLKTCRTFFMFPAQRDDGLSVMPDCLPEGARLQLDPAYDVRTDRNPPLTKAIERAAQTYGIVIRDKTADTFSFYGQDPSPLSTNPYTSGPGVGGVDNGGLGWFGGVAPSQLFRHFPWSRLRVIAGTRCSAAPCGP